MELRQLKYFVKTAQTLNFSEAARLLFVTQSTLSQQIRQLEQELGVELFMRDSHSVRLTESGEYLLPGARRTLQEADSCFAQVRDLQQMLTGSLDIGITYSFAPVLTEAVREFTRQYPGIKLNIVCRNMTEILDLLKRREVDFVLCFKPAVLDADIESHTLFDTRLAVILGRDHPLADRTSLTPEDLRPYALALPAKETQARNILDVSFPGAVSSLNVAVEINDVHVLLDLVRATRLVTVLSENVLYRSEALKAIPLDAPLTQMEGCVHTLKKTYRKRAVDEFIRILSQSDAVMERAHMWLK